MTENKIETTTDAQLYNVYKNGKISETEKEMSESKAEKLDGFTQYNPDANGGDGDFEQFRVEKVDQVEE